MQFYREFRQDGRKSDEIRNIETAFNVNTQADGSVLYKQGLNSIIVSIQQDQATTNAKSSEILQEVFNTVILSENVKIDSKILNQDSCIRTNLINAVTVALIHAGVPIKNFISSCTACWEESKQR